MELDMYSYVMGATGVAGAVLYFHLFLKLRGWWKWRRQQDMRWHQGRFLRPPSVRRRVT